MVKVSIIVPVYNAQAHLGKCIESLISQTLKDIEIVCVNDGSTDDSLDILNFFAIQDKRIRIINQSNKGVSASRNAGLDVAKGKYVMFVDGDDWIEPETCAECYKKIIADKADMLVFNYHEYKEGKGLSNTSHHLDNITKDVFRFNSSPEDFFYILTSVWGKLYKNKDLPTFNEDLKKGEDSVFFWTYCLQNNPIISIMNYPYYYYYLRSNSAMHQEQHICNNEIIRSVNKLMLLPAYNKTTNQIKMLILDRFAQSLLWEAEHSKQFLDNIYWRQIEIFLRNMKCIDTINKLRFAPKLNKLMFLKQHYILMYLFKIFSYIVSIEYRPRHKVIKILGIRIKLKRIGGKIGAEQYYIDYVCKNSHNYPKDTYLLFDCLHDITAEAIDAYSLFEQMKAQNIPAYYVVRKQTALYQKLVSENKLDNVITLSFSTRTHPNEFMQKIYKILLRTKCIITSFGENSHTVAKFFKKYPEWQYIFIQHGPTFLKESV